MTKAEEIPVFDAQKGEYLKMLCYRYTDPHVKDYKNPLHLDVLDQYQPGMGDKSIPDEAPPLVPGIDLPQSRCCGFFVSFIDKKHI